MSHKHTDYRFVLVVWRDSHSQHGWRDIDEVDNVMKPITSCGWLIKETEHTVTLSSSIGGWDSLCDPMTIPMEAVVYLDDVPLPDLDEQLELARDPSLSA